ncbi:UPF0669 protein C6orf120 homolog [Cimex lectularius]|uniref:Uncharacterized protein n=1 Tax=Cimex lectularius TaxID=79782 RepID=A0A8I6SPR5_CIMLE|nr:UPF0669 protein C6orf120 homolog [Cimex lectularius]
MQIKLTTVLTICLLPFLDAEIHYFKSASGTITAGNFTYYRLITEGAIQVILHTNAYIDDFRKGDADLYISERVETPTYEIDSYCLHSATCGVDVIDIPSSFARPVGIGVYGHPSHDESDFILEVKLTEDQYEHSSPANERDESQKEHILEEVNLFLLKS